MASLTEQKARDLFVQEASLQVLHDQIANLESAFKILRDNGFDTGSDTYRQLRSNLIETLTSYFEDTNILQQRLGTFFGTGSGKALIDNYLQGVIDGNDLESSVQTYLSSSDGQALIQDAVGDLTLGDAVDLYLGSSVGNRQIQNAVAGVDISNKVENLVNNYLQTAVTSSSVGVSRQLAINDSNHIPRGWMKIDDTGQYYRLNDSNKSIEKTTDNGTTSSVVQALSITSRTEELYQSWLEAGSLGVGSADVRIYLPKSADSQNFTMTYDVVSTTNAFANIDIREITLNYAPSSFEWNAGVNGVAFGDIVKMGDTFFWHQTIHETDTATIDENGNVIVSKKEYLFTSNNGYDWVQQALPSTFVNGTNDGENEFFYYKDNYYIYQHANGVSSVFRIDVTNASSENSAQITEDIALSRNTIVLYNVVGGVLYATVVDSDSGVITGILQFINSQWLETKLATRSGDLLSLNDARNESNVFFREFLTRQKVGFNRIYIRREDVLFNGRVDTFWYQIEI